ncbi:glycosaminoglycan attachment protein [Paenibacillus luteus]|uniref:glycosaminoglycan attachment protein n=1 Tax=Paenibacillus luteus TaxID=2545753 RepID=UPI001143960D|nr:glycosaminoglycan attachment protein [Paenibacillus luteus]
MNDLKTLWGVICLDRQDKNYTVIFSARDENRQIRCINLKINIENIDLARSYLFSYSKDLELTEIVNGVINKNVVKDLFIPIVKTSKLDRYFDFISKSPTHSGARSVINEIMPHFFDVDGNFVEQFQTRGFDSRLWELYLFCYFNEEGLLIDRSHFAPDFLLRSNNMDVSLEAVIVANKEPDKIWTHMPKLEDVLSDQEIMPAKWGSSLYSKLTHTDKSRRHYWEYSHTEEKPFILAIADFHETFSMTWSQNSLITYLYGYKYHHSYNEKGELIIHPIKVEKHSKGEGRNTIPSGFFFQDNSENVSAVLHSSCATISKFSRIGKQCGLDESDVLMYRIGSVHNPDPNANKPNRFQYLVTEENSEPWAEGVTVFHNPNAKYPLTLDFFPSAAQCYLQDEFIVTISNNPVVYSSVTLNFVEESKLENFKAHLSNTNKPNR